MRFKLILCEYTVPANLRFLCDVILYFLCEYSLKYVRIQISNPVDGHSRTFFVRLQRIVEPRSVDEDEPVAIYLMVFQADRRHLFLWMKQDYFPHVVQFG